MPSSHLIHCRPLLLPPSIFPSVRVFSDESALRIRWPKYWEFQHQSFQWTPRTDLLQDGLVGSPWSPKFKTCSTIVQKHQFFGAQLSSQSNSHIHTRPLEKPEPWLDGSVVSNSLRPHELYPARLLCPWESPGKNIGVDCNTLLQGIFLTQGSNPGLLHYRWILYSWATGKVHMQCSLAF